VCAEWHCDYQKFKEWALNNGYREGLDLCRKDVTRNYVPKNCYFATAAQSAQHKTSTKMTWGNVRNMRQLYQDESMSQDQLAKKYKISSATVSRIVNYKLWAEE